jgi:CRISPR-associated protein Csa1
MVFFLSAQEHKYLINRILPLAREVGVTPELRGWSWWKEPMKPYHSGTISMFSVCGKFCPTGRDVYLTYVEKKTGKETHEITLGAAAHNLLEHVFGKMRTGDFSIGFEDWWKGELDHRGRLENPEIIHSCLAPLWDLAISQAKASYLEAKAAHPYAEERDLLATAIPFLVEHKLNGRLLGLSGTLSVDCYDYFHHIIFDVKVGGPVRDFYHLYPAGYALVFESLYEIPVDVGCSIHVGFRNGRVVVNRDLFFINDDVRNWWIEERDKKMACVAQRKDPGKPKDCPPNCMFFEVCT